MQPTGASPDVSSGTTSEGKLAPPRISTAGASGPVRLCYLVSHPIQYQAPLLRRIAAEPGIDLTVLFGSDFSIHGYQDDGFGVAIQWDIPLLDGYRHEFLPALRDRRTEGFATPISRGLFHRLNAGTAPGTPFDLLWVHGYATINQMQGILAANLLGIPVLIRSDSSLRDRPRSGLRLHLKRAFFAILRKLVDGVLVTGTLNRDYWQHYLGLEFPLFLLPYAVDNAWFQQQVKLAAATRAQLQAELTLDPARPVILFASKLQTRKHCDDLIAAFERLQHLSPRPYLLIVGEGEERPALEAQAAGLEGVRFCGFRNQSELPRFFDLATVFVLPARHEPWGLIVNEVMNAAKPVILTDDIGCQPDLIRDGIEGLVYPVRDIAALTTALTRILTQPTEATAMGARALTRIDRWSFDQDIAGLRAALAHLTGKLPGRRPQGEDA